MCVYNTGVQKCGSVEGRKKICSGVDNLKTVCEKVSRQFDGYFIVLNLILKYLACILHVFKFRILLIF